MIDGKYKPFYADASSRNGDCEVEVIPTNMETYGIRMTILAKAGPIYITKQEAMKFFDLRSNE